MFQSYKDNLFCGWTSSCFFIGQNNYSVFCNQKQGSTKNVNANLPGNLYGATYFFFFARFTRSVFKTLINNKMSQSQIHTPHSLLKRNKKKTKKQHFIITFTPEVTFLRERFRVKLRAYSVFKVEGIILSPDLKGGLLT